MALCRIAVRRQKNPGLDTGLFGRISHGRSVIPRARSDHLLYWPAAHSLRQCPRCSSDLERSYGQLRFQLQIDTPARRLAKERRSNQPRRRKILCKKSSNLTNGGNTWLDLQIGLPCRGTHPATADAAGSRFLVSTQS